MTECISMAIPRPAHDHLCDLADAEGIDIDLMLVRLIERAHSVQRFAAADRAYAAVAADPEAEQAWREALALWERTLGDGLSAEPWPDLAEEAPAVSGDERD